MAGVEGKVALVTGAAGGIGRETAVLLALGRAAVIGLVDLDGAGLAETAELVANLGTGAVTLEADLTEEASVPLIVSTVVDAAGQLDLAVNNAGISGGYALTAELDTEDWDRIIATNLTSVFWCMRAEIGAMVAAGGGAIVNVSSGAGLVGAPGQAGYAAAKHGVLGLTRTASREYAGAGVRINAVCPGTTRTPMLEGFLDANPGAEERMARMAPVHRLGQADEIAQSIVWLLSDEASFVHGHSLVVDGGALGR